jgi:hypothetical protein
MTENQKEQKLFKAIFSSSKILNDGKQKFLPELQHAA